MNIFKQRAIEFAQSIELDFQSETKDKPLGKINILKLEMLHAKLTMLTDIFTSDLSDEEKKSDPLGEITEPLTHNLSRLSDDVRARMKSTFAEAAAAL